MSLSLTGKYWMPQKRATNEVKKMIDVEKHAVQDFEDKYT